MTHCPKCGERIQATVPVYLDHVVLDDDGKVTGFELSFTDDREHGGAFDWESDNPRLYCANDHVIEWTGIDADAIPQLCLKGD